MATWTDPATLNTGPDDPVTAEFGTATLENPTAIAEGATGAPRVATKNQFGSGTVGNRDFPVTNMGGARFFINVRNGGGALRTMTINASDGSFGTAQTLLTLDAGDEYSAHGYVDFATGNFSVTQGSSSINVGTLTITSGITTLRFTGAADLTFSIHNMPDGGETTV